MHVRVCMCVCVCVHVCARACDYMCFMMAGTDLAPISGQCWHESFDRTHCSNVICAHRPLALGALRRLANDGYVRRTQSAAGWWRCFAKAKRFLPAALKEMGYDDEPRTDDEPADRAVEPLLSPRQEMLSSRYERQDKCQGWRSGIRGWDRR